MKEQCFLSVSISVPGSGEAPISLGKWGKVTFQWRAVWCIAWVGKGSQRKKLYKCGSHSVQFLSFKDGLLSSSYLILVTLRTLKYVNTVEVLSYLHILSRGDSSRFALSVSPKQVTPLLEESVHFITWCSGEDKFSHVVWRIWNRAERSHVHAVGPPLVHTWSCGVEPVHRSAQGFIKSSLVQQQEVISLSFVSSWQGPPPSSSL